MLAHSLNDPLDFKTFAVKSFHKQYSLLKWESECILVNESSSSILKQCSRAEVTMNQITSVFPCLTHSSTLSESIVVGVFGISSAVQKKVGGICRSQQRAVLKWHTAQTKTLSRFLEKDRLRQTTFYSKYSACLNG